MPGLRRASPTSSRVNSVLVVVATGYASTCKAAQSRRRPESSGVAAPTSTTASAGTFGALAAATIASGEGAS